MQMINIKCLIKTRLQKHILHWTLQMYITETVRQELGIRSRGVLCRAYHDKRVM